MARRGGGRRCVPPHTSSSPKFEFDFEFECVTWSLTSLANIRVCWMNNYCLLQSATAILYQCIEQALLQSATNVITKCDVITKCGGTLPRAINFKFPQQLHQKYYITQHEELGSSSLTLMGKMIILPISHYLTYAFLFDKVGRMYFLK